MLRLSMLGVIRNYLDMTTLRRSNLDQKRVNVDLPIWMIQKLDRQANLIGVTRQSIIKV